MTNSQNKETKRKFFFKILAISASSLAIIYFAYYYFIGSHHIKTDNAYVGAEVAQIASVVNGIIKQVNVTDTQNVNAGDVLVTIDNTDAKLALANANANLAKAKAEEQKAKSNFERRRELKAIESVSEEELSDSKNLLKVASAAVEIAKVLTSQAELDLKRTTIYAPISGTVARRQVQLGQRVQTGEFLMSITPKNQMHINANFKEVQLKKVKIGQVVEAFSDKYGKGIIYHGKVAGLSGGTGSAFAIIPAQNATGNWIKVVQRVPIRIELSPEELEKNPLQIGLSMHVDIDISDHE